MTKTKLLFLMAGAVLADQVTKAAALSLLGPGYRWNTAILMRGRLEGDVLAGHAASRTVTGQQPFDDHGAVLPPFPVRQPR